MSQLPEGTLGDAIGVLIFTFICLFANSLLLWLYWISRERLSCTIAALQKPVMKIASATV